MARRPDQVIPLNRKTLVRSAGDKPLPALSSEITDKVRKVRGRGDVRGSLTQAAFMSSQSGESIDKQANRIVNTLRNQLKKDPNLCIGLLYSANAEQADVLVAAYGQKVIPVIGGSGQAALFARVITGINTSLIPEQQQRVRILPIATSLHGGDNTGTNKVSAQDLQADLAIIDAHLRQGWDVYGIPRSDGFAIGGGVSQSWSTSRYAPGDAHLPSEAQNFHAVTQGDYIAHQLESMQRLNQCPNKGLDLFSDSPGSPSSRFSSSSSSSSSSLSSRSSSSSSSRLSVPPPPSPPPPPPSSPPPKSGFDAAHLDAIRKGVALKKTAGAAPSMSSPLSPAKPSPGRALGVQTPSGSGRAVMASSGVMGELTSELALRGRGGSRSSSTPHLSSISHPSGAPTSSGSSGSSQLSSSPALRGAPTLTRGALRPTPPRAVSPATPSDVSANPFGVILRPVTQRGGKATPFSTTPIAAMPPTKTRSLDASSSSSSSSPFSSAFPSSFGEKPYHSFLSNQSNTSETPHRPSSALSSSSSSRPSSLAGFSKLKEPVKGSESKPSLFSSDSDEELFAFPPRSTPTKSVKKSVSFAELPAAPARTPVTPRSSKATPTAKTRSLDASAGSRASDVVPTSLPSVLWHSDSSSSSSYSSSDSDDDYSPSSVSTQAPIGPRLVLWDNDSNSSSSYSSSEASDSGDDNDSPFSVRRLDLSHSGDRVSIQPSGKFPSPVTVTRGGRAIPAGHVVPPASIRTPSRQDVSTSTPKLQPRRDDHSAAPLGTSVLPSTGTPVLPASRSFSVSSASPSSSSSFLSGPSSSSSSSTSFSGSAFSSSRSSSADIRTHGVMPRHPRTFKELFDAETVKQAAEQKATPVSTSETSSSSSLSLGTKAFLSSFSRKPSFQAGDHWRAPLPSNPAMHTPQDSSAGPLQRPTSSFGGPSFFGGAQPPTQGFGRGGPSRGHSRGH